MTKLTGKILHWCELGRGLVVGHGQPSRVVGLDASGQQIKLTVFKRSRRPHLEAFAVERVDAAGFKTEQKLWEHQRLILRSLVDEHDLQGLPTVVVLPISDYTRRQLILPKMPARELRKAIVYETEKLSGESLQDKVIDYLTINEFDQEGSRYGSHLVVIAKRTALDVAMERLGELDLQLAGFAVVPLALRNVLRAQADLKPGSSSCLLDLGKQDVSLSLFRGDELIFTRDIPGSGSQLTNALTSIVVEGPKNIELDYWDAEAIKIEYGILEDEDRSGTTDRGVPLEQVAVMMRPVLERMLIEIQRSIDFCQEQYGTEPPQRMFLSGGGAKLKNLDRFLSSRLHMDVDFVRPAAFLQLGPSIDPDYFDDHQQELITALGLGLNTKGSICYFVPNDYAQRNYRIVKTVSRVAAGIAVAASSALFVTTDLNNRAAEEQLSLKRATLQNLQGFEDGHKSEVEAVKRARFKRRMVLSLLGNDLPWASVLRDVSRRVGDDVQLTEVKWEEVNREEVSHEWIRFKGVVSTERQRPEYTVATLLAAFGGSPYFDDVQLDDVQTLRDGLAGFNFRCRVVH